jgi:hypothetical protein
LEKYQNLIPKIDRAIRLYGADFRLDYGCQEVTVRTKEKKGTSEVDGSKKTGDKSHGGDGSSGEVENSKQGSEASGKNEASGHCEGKEVSERDQSSGQGPEKGTGASQQVGKPGPETPAEKPSQSSDAQCGDARRSVNSGKVGSRQEANLSQDGSAEGQTSEEAVPGQGGSKMTKNGRTEGTSRRPNQRGASAASTISEEEVLKELLGKRSVPTRLVAVCERKIKSTIGHGAAGPRLDSEKLMFELLSKQCRLSQTRKQEDVKRHVLIAVDTSGSCSASSSSMLAAAATVARHLDNVIVVSHVNGQPRQVVIGKKARLVECAYGSRAQRLREWEAIVSKKDVCAVWWFGDNDGQVEMDFLSKKFPNIEYLQFDNYRCSFLEPHRGSPSCPGWETWWAVGDLTQLITALEKSGK